MKAKLLLIAGVALLLSALGTGLMRRYALRRNLLDIPNLRSSHLTPVPRGGGVAVVAAFLVALAGFAWFDQFDLRVTLALILGGASIAWVGFLDDRRTVPALVRFAVHAGVACLTVYLIGGIPAQTLHGWGLHGRWLGAVLAVLVLVWSTNLFNFMDGIDGIAGSEAFFVAGSGACLAAFAAGDFAMAGVMLSLAGAALGFLLWNWPPAKIFMGDVGSGFLGFTLGALALAFSQREAAPVEVWPILAGVFVVDATLTLIRRMLRGDRWFTRAPNPCIPAPRPSF